MPDDDGGSASAAKLTPEARLVEAKDDDKDDSGSDAGGVARSTAEPGEIEQRQDGGEAQASAKDPPLPEEEVPPLPDEAIPTNTEDDGWEPVWEDSAQTYYFYNRVSGASQWTNPRIPDAASVPAAPGTGGGVGNYDRIDNGGGGQEEGEVEEDETGELGRRRRARPHGGYDPAIHGDYDPNAPYAQDAYGGDPTTTAGGVGDPSQQQQQSDDPNAIYTATGVFNRFTGKWQPTALAPENFNDENKSRRQMNAFFDVDAAANSHDGKSLKAERSGKKLTKKEVKDFKEKRREKKEEKRRAWLRD